MGSRLYCGYFADRCYRRIAPHSTATVNTAGVKTTNTAATALPDLASVAELSDELSLMILRPVLKTNGTGPLLRNSQSVATMAATGKGNHNSILLMFLDHLSGTDSIFHQYC